MKRQALLNLFVSLSLVFGSVLTQSVGVSYAATPPVIPEGNSVSVTMSKNGAPPFSPGSERHG